MYLGKLWGKPQLNCLNQSFLKKRQISPQSVLLAAVTVAGKLVANYRPWKIFISLQSGQNFPPEWQNSLLYFFISPQNPKIPQEGISLFSGLFIYFFNLFLAVVINNKACLSLWQCNIRALSIVRTIRSRDTICAKFWI